MVDEKKQKFLRDFAATIGKNDTPTPKRIKRPELPPKGRLSKSNQWKSLMWMVDTATEHGRESLTGLAIALSRIIQAKVFEALFLNARFSAVGDTDIADLLWNPSLKIMDNSYSLNELLRPSKKPITINIGNHAVFPSPWEPWRLGRAMQTIGPQGSKWRQDSNHHAIAWLPWPLIWVNNGNHSTTAGMLRGGGKLRCHTAYDASELLKCVRTDGAQWFSTDNNKPFAKVQSVPMAAIFVIGQRLIELPTPAIKKMGRSKRQEQSKKH